MRILRKNLKRLGAAAAALRRNILRSLLTMLGIVIGIMAVVSIMEIGNGASVTLGESIENMGSNLIVILPGAASAGGIQQGVGTAPTLTPEDVDAIAERCPQVAAVAPVVQARTQIVYGSTNWNPANMFGTSPDYLRIRDWETLDEGECFSEQDVRNSNRVCIIGKTLVTNLFSGASPIGETIRIQNVPFTVIGVLRQKGANVMGMDQDDILITPWTTMKFRISGQAASSSENATTGNGITSIGSAYPRSHIEYYPQATATQLMNTPRQTRTTTVSQIMASAVSTDAIPAAQDQIQATLDDTHRIRPGETADYTIRNMTELSNMFGSTTTLMTSLLLVIAAISLLVGGVGIMNIMLVSVTERTQEIGLRMAVGAKGRDIMIQFLVEAVLLCLIGATIGICLARGVSMLVTLLLGWPIAASVTAIVGAVSVSALIGIGFGFYPAWRAAQLDPIDALRYE
jgi:ABC-type antimicrobial peptide transport system permease subunit